MPKTAAISLRVDTELKDKIEEEAKKQRRSIASFVEGVLISHVELPRWILADPQPIHREGDSPAVFLSVAEGWPGVVLPAEKAKALGEQLIATAKMATELPPAE